MRLLAFFCSKILATVIIQITNIVFVLQTQGSLAAAVKWKRVTNPVLFGQNVTLTCVIDRKEGCDITATRRWDAGPDRNTLLFNGHSSNSSKYYEISKEPCENFSMVIMKFDRTDVDMEYWCSFGFDTSRQMLKLDDQNYIGIPTKTDSNFENDKQRGLNLKISFEKVYPEPKCKIKIGEKRWTPLTVVSHPTGIFFNSSVHYKTSFPKSQCHSNVTTICSLLQSYTIIQLNKRLNCTDEGVPATLDSYSSLENDKQRKLHLKISFYKVYQKPECKMKIGSTSWVPITLVSHPTGIYFNSSVHYITNFPKSQCHSNVTTICSLCSSTILQLNKRLNCTDEGWNGEKTLKMAMVITLVVIIATVSFVIGFMHIKTKLKAKPKNIFSIIERLGGNKEELQSFNS